jgi:alpha-L-fucosidase 2
MTNNLIDEITARANLDPSGTLLYDRPAGDWFEALPLGNGSLGAMAYGDVSADHYQLNHDTLYSDEPGRRDLDLDVTRDFDKVVSLLKSRKYEEADRICTANWLGRSWPCYQPMADLLIDVALNDSPDRYVRVLDLNSAVDTVACQKNGRHYQRECFASHPDGVLVIRMLTDDPKGLSLKLTLTSVHPTAVTESVIPDTIGLTGQAPGLALRRSLDLIEERGEVWKYPELWDSSGRRKPGASQILYGEQIEGRGMHFSVRALARATGGSVLADHTSVSVDGAREVVVLVAAATSYAGFDKSPTANGRDSVGTTDAILSAASARPYQELLARHISDYCELFNRLKLTLGGTSSLSSATTDRRIQEFAQSDDHALAALYYQFSRYLAISGSRPGTQPLNLQGIWNGQVIPPWASAYTININTQMNYWPVESGNLIECARPLMTLIDELAVSGRRVARDMYGRDGWVAHHNTSLWRSAQPVDNVAQTSFWPMGSGWLCRHLWDHFLYTCDETFLECQAYPLMKGAAEFYLDWLIEDDRGFLLTPVGTSPENDFVYVDEEGLTRQAAVSMGPTMDMAIIRECFTMFLQAADLLDTDHDLCVRIRKALPWLLPYRVAPDGQLREWSHDLPGYDPQHRHLSHLYGAFPSDQITQSDTPELYDAVGRTLEVRGEGSGGWSLAWKVCLRARRHEGEAGFRLLRKMLSPQLTHPNLLNGHRHGNGRQGLFQIDGNMGGAAGIMEMLVQSTYRPSREGEGRAVVELLPSLPSAWSDGSLHGARCRGGLVIAMDWESAHLRAVTARSTVACSLELRYADRIAAIPLPASAFVKLDGDLLRVASG